MIDRVHGYQHGVICFLLSQGAKDVVEVKPKRIDSIDKRETIFMGKT